MRSHASRAARAAAAVGAIGAIVAIGCAPSPQNVPCRNDGECASNDERFAFCLRRQCVECVGRGSCDGHPCNDGVCQIPCDGDRDCKDGRTCQGGLCVHQ